MTVGQIIDVGIIVHGCKKVNGLGAVDCIAMSSDLKHCYYYEANGWVESAISWSQEENRRYLENLELRGAKVYAGKSTITMGVQ